MVIPEGDGARVHACHRKLSLLLRLSFFGLNDKAVQAVVEPKVILLPVVLW